MVFSPFFSDYAIDTGAVAITKSGQELKIRALKRKSTFSRKKML